MATLTERERQIVRLLGKGLAPKQIARQLGTSHNTVRQQLYKARDKAGCQSTIELAIKIAQKERE